MNKLAYLQFDDYVVTLYETFKQGISSANPAAKKAYHVEVTHIKASYVNFSQDCVYPIEALCQGLEIVRVFKENDHESATE